MKIPLMGPQETLKLGESSPGQVPSMVPVIQWAGNLEFVVTTMFAVHQSSLGFVLDPNF